MLHALRPHFLNRYVALELGLFAGIIVAFVFPGLGESVFRPVERVASAIAHRKRLALFGIFLATILVRVGLLAASPEPIPKFHDEFSYLLEGDTFARGRLTNPPHPMWAYLDTVHVNQRPTYMSKYPPGQGFFLALGELLGNPWFGVVLSAAAMCAAVLWMLQGWLPPAWAFLGASLAFLRLAVFSYWINSYWGGAVAAIGGALVLGAFPRILHRHQARDALILGLGVGILANSRPFEGFVLCLPVLAAVSLWMGSRRSPHWNALARSVVLPLALVAILFAAFGAFYNWRGTGSPWLMPYALNERTYSSTPLFLWQKERPALRYENPQFQAFYGDWMHGAWLATQPDRLSKLWRHVHEVLGGVARFFLWPALCLPLAGLPWLLRDRRIRWHLMTCGACLVASLSATWFEPHYIAPLTACIFALVVQCCRHIRLWKPGHRATGVALVRVTVLFAIFAVLIHPPGIAAGPEPPPGMEDRARIAAKLSTLPGLHLAIVRYATDHNVHSEWVYNSADIDRSKIVWAREIPGRDIQPLLNYFHDRQLWLVEPDLSPPQLLPYSEARP